MASAFVSHSSIDKYFADLLVRVLEYHHIDLWYDTSGIARGEKFKEKIKDGLRQSDYLIVVVSENSMNSKWVVRELAEFLAIKPDARVIPLLLSDVKLDDVFDDLGDYQAILFYKNMLEGFEELLRLFDQEFLPSQDRRAGSDRRIGSDRRKHDPKQRLRYGLWKSFEESTGKGKFDVYEESILSIGQFTRAVMPGAETGDDEKSELSRYEFFDKASGEKIAITQDLIDQYFYLVIEDLRKVYASSIKNVYITDGLAEKLVSLYEVKPRDQRTESRRRGKDG